MLDAGYFARKSVEPIKIDGGLNEETWDRAQKAGNFIQNFPVDTLLASAKTEVMVSYDEKYIYFAAKVYNSVPNQPVNDFTVLALQQKVFHRSSVGLIVTNKEVQGSKDFNRVAGVDYNIASKSNVWNGKLFYMQSFDPIQTVNDKAFGGIIVYNIRDIESRKRLFQIGNQFNPEVGYLRKGGFWRYAGDLWLKYYPKKGMTDYDLNFLYNI